MPPTQPQNLRTAIREWLDNVKRDLAAVKEAWTGLGQPGHVGRLIMLPKATPTPRPTPEEHARGNALKIGTMYLYLAGALLGLAVNANRLGFLILMTASAILIWRALKLIRLSKEGTWMPPTKPERGDRA